MASAILENLYLVTADSIHYYRPQGYWKQSEWLHNTKEKIKWGPWWLQQNDIHIATTTKIETLYVQVCWRLQLEGKETRRPNTINVFCCWGEVWKTEKVTMHIIDLYMYIEHLWLNLIDLQQTFIKNQTSVTNTMLQWGSITIPAFMQFIDVLKR